jgi:hypothetical protein
MKLIHGRYRFIFWITLFSLLLSNIIFLIVIDLILIAKILGVMLVVTLVIALSIWRNQVKNKSNMLPRIPININDRFWLREHILFYRNLNNQDKQIFENRLGLILSNVDISCSNKIERKNDLIRLSCIAVILFWDFPVWTFYGDKWILTDDKNFQSEEAFVFDKDVLIDSLNSCSPLLSKLKNEADKENFTFNLPERLLMRSVIKRNLQIESSQKMLHVEKDFFELMNKLRESHSEISQLYNF